MDSPAESFHENSKIARLPNAGEIGTATRRAMARGYKSYPSAKRIGLPAGNRGGELSVLDAIARRASVREYAPGPIDVADLDTILACANGESPTRPGRRAVPSGGGLYPLELYVAVLVSGELDRGVYHYEVREHALELLPAQPDPDRIRSSIFVSEAASTAAVFLVVTAMFGRSRIKYGERGYRFALMESGHLMQNVALACAALNLGCCPFGGFVDDEVHAVLGVDGVDEAALYLATLGRLQ